MIRRSQIFPAQYRGYDNLPAPPNSNGALVTSFITPYRHWAWKQNELWRNVHEAQFEHLRGVYKRQWFESFRVNADEYIHKYNITKAAQLTDWENEMHAQDARRLDKLRSVQARDKLSDKRRDLFREIHERDFFHWYERASERLQAMTKIPFISREKISDHIDKELDKYVEGRDGPYPLNFVGQMPVLEDADLNITRVPSSLMANFNAERPTAGLPEYTPPAAVSQSDRLSGVISNEAHDLFGATDTAAAAQLNQALDEMASEAVGEEAIVDEKTDEEVAKDRRAYIDRGKVGSKHRVDWKQSSRSSSQTIAPESTTALGAQDGLAGKKGGAAAGPAKKRTQGPGRRDRQQLIKDAVARQQDSDAYLHSHLKKSDAPIPSVGEVATRIPKLRDRLHMPGMEDVLKHPIMATQAAGATAGDLSRSANKQNPKE